MSTRLYLTSDETNVYDPASAKGAWDQTTGVKVERLGTHRFGTGFAATRNETSATNNFDVLCVRFVSEPIHANVTISGTMDAIVLACEDAADSNDVLHLHVWVTQGDSATVRGTLVTDYVDTAEFAVSGFSIAASAVTIAQQTVSSVAAQVGDRIVVEAGFQSQSTVSGFREGTIVCGGRSSVDAVGTESLVAINNNSPGWVEFSAAIVFTPTYLFTVNETVPVTPGATRGTWDIDDHTDFYLARTPGSIVTAGSKANHETTTTNPTDAVGLRLVSDQLATQTISADTVTFMVGQNESDAAADAFPKAHLYVMKPDGSVRGTLISNSVGGTEISSSGSNPPPIVRTAASSALAVSLGDRMVLELGARFTNTTASDMSVTTWAIGGAGMALSSLGVSLVDSDGSGGWIRFTQHILFADLVGFPYSQVIWVGGGA